jgi:hypothetical protein
MIASCIPGAPDPNFSKGIKDEHTVLWGSDQEFTTSNYGLTTTPKKEYEISTGAQTCPPMDMLDRNGNRVRVVQSLEELKRLKLSQQARLTDDEILAVVCALPIPASPSSENGQTSHGAAA